MNAKLAPGFGARIGSEARRALVATAIGVALGAVVALFAREEYRERRWRGRSRT